MPTPTPPTPQILLLKSPSPTPTTDSYTTTLTPLTPAEQIHYIPILTHTLLPDPLIKLLLAHLDCGLPHALPFQYGALILTSQRAVASLSSALHAPPVQAKRALLRELRVRLYAVGPATGRALEGVRDEFLDGCEIFGGKGAGSGEVLAGMMLGKGEGEYDVVNEDGRGRRPVLFLTGETRRDVIPRMLMDERLGERRVQVDEMVVYTTAELDEFEFNFAKVLLETDPLVTGGAVRWTVVFSPMAGKGMLIGLGWWDERAGKCRENLGERKTYVCCIGPTTREYLRGLGFETDVMAEKPSPQGVKDGIEKYMKEKLMSGRDRKDLAGES